MFDNIGPYFLRDNGVGIIIVSLRFFFNEQRLSIISHFDSTVPDLLSLIHLPGSGLGL